jgi:hypothetical protein
VADKPRASAPWKSAVASERLAAGQARFLKRQLSLPVSNWRSIFHFSTFLQILLVHSFEKVRLSCAFQSFDDSNRDPSPANQLNKLDF